MYFEKLILQIDSPYENIPLTCKHILTFLNFLITKLLIIMHNVMVQYCLTPTPRLLPTYYLYYLIFGFASLMQQLPCKPNQYYANQNQSIVAQVVFFVTLIVLNIKML